MNFLNENMQLHIAKGLKLNVISNILNLNFRIEKYLIEHIPLSNISTSIMSWLEMF